MEKLASEEGINALILSQSGIPLARTQSELTPLQRDCLIRAYNEMKRRESEAMRRGR